jgi:transposase
MLDNTKTGVTKACFFEPDLNPSYLEMEHRYDTFILLTRAPKRRGKAKAEGAVQLVKRWILALIRFHIKQFQNPYAAACS